jgi:hypothetical protein
MNNFDLNISHYTPQELVEIFKLESGYQEIDVLNQEEILAQKIQRDTQINVMMKENLLKFMRESAKIIIANNKDKNSHDLIEAPKTPCIPSMPSHYFAGIMNPLKRRTIEKTLNIDTRFRRADTPSTNFRIDLPIFFNNVMTMKLSSFSYPSLTAFNISKGCNNNIFYLDGEKVIIPDGVYEPHNLIQFLNTLSATISFVNSANRLQITSLNNFTVSFPEPLNLSFGWIVGFRETDLSGSNFYIGQESIDLQVLKYCFLCINDYNNNVNNNIISAFNNSLLNTNILARITFQKGFPALIDKLPREYFGPVNINALQVSLLDCFGKFLPSEDYSFCLTFDIVYDL